MTVPTTRATPIEPPAITPSPEPRVRRLLLAAARLVGAAIYHARLHRLWIRLVPGPRVLLFHACRPAESDWTRGLRLNTTPEGMAQVAQYLKDHYSIVSLTQLEAGEAPRRCAAITFDDGFRSIHQHAFPILREHGVPATVYLIANTFGESRNCWVNRVNLQIHRNPERVLDVVREEWPELEAGDAEELLPAMVSDFDPTKVGAVLQSESLLEEPEERLHLNEEEIAEMAESGWTFGNHTCTHPNLARLSASEVTAELDGAQQALRGLPGMTDSLSYPFGYHDASVREEAMRQGATSIMEVGGWNFSWKRDRVARIPVDGTSPKELFVEIEVVALLKGILRRLLERPLSRQPEQLS